MVSPRQNDSDVRTPLVIARMAAAFFALVCLVMFLMYAGHPAYGKLFVLTTIVLFLALLVFAFFPRQAYAVDIVRNGAIALSVFGIILGVMWILGDPWDIGALVFGVILVGLLALMAHEALTWEQEK